MYITIRQRPDPTVPVDNLLGFKSTTYQNSRPTTCNTIGGGSKSRPWTKQNNNANDNLASPQLNPEETDPYLNSQAITRNQAAEKIAIWWHGQFMRRTFKTLKTILLRAESSMTVDMLRTISPLEAALLKDPLMKPKVRLRFGGTQFPPSIYYKVYTNSRAVQYFSGTKFIAPGTQAAVDSCKMMGNRLFTENFIIAESQLQSYRISEAYEVTNRLDFIQYMTSLDERPTYLGGRNNGWRELSALPFIQQQAFYDVFTKLGYQSDVERYYFDPDRFRRLQQVASPLSALKNIDELKAEKRRQKLEKLRKLYGIQGRNNGGGGEGKEKEDDDNEEPRIRGNNGDDNRINDYNKKDSHRKYGRDGYNNDVGLEDLEFEKAGDDEDAEFRRLYAWSNTLSVDLI